MRTTSGTGPTEVPRRLGQPRAALPSPPPSGARRVPRGDERSRTGVLQSRWECARGGPGAAVATAEPSSTIVLPATPSTVTGTRTGPRRPTPAFVQVRTNSASCGGSNVSRIGSGCETPDASTTSTSRIAAARDPADFDDLSGLLSTDEREIGRQDGGDHLHLRHPASRHVQARHRHLRLSRLRLRIGHHAARERTLRAVLLEPRRPSIRESFPSWLVLVRCASARPRPRPIPRTGPSRRARNRAARIA